MPDETCAECKRHGTLSVWARDLGQDRDGFVSFCARHAPAHSTIMNRRLYELLDREKERATLHARAEAAERRVRELEGALLKGTEHTSGLAGFAAGLMNGAGLDGKNHPRVLAALAWEESIRDLLVDKALAGDAGQEGGAGD